jgi:hypothetical protein
MISTAKLTLAIKKHQYGWTAFSLPGLGWGFDDHTAFFDRHNRYFLGLWGRLIGIGEYPSPDSDAATSFARAFGHLRCVLAPLLYSRAIFQFEIALSLTFVRSQLHLPALAVF